MDLGTQEVVDALEVAVRMEKEGAKLYDDAAARANQPWLKKFFAELSADELMHRATFEGLLGARLDPGIIEDMLDRVAQMSELGIFPGDGADIEAISSATPELEVLTLAMRWEDEAIAHYQEMLEWSLTDEGRKAIEIIIRMEQDHSRLLGAQRDSLIKTGRWLSPEDR